MSTIILSGFTAYAITKHELMDIRVIISRGGAIIIVGVLLIISFFLLNIFAIPAPLLTILNVLLGIFWAVNGSRLRLFFQTSAEKKFIRGWYDYNSVMTELFDSTTAIIEKETLLTSIRDILKRNLEIDRIAILYKSKDNFDKLAFKVLLDSLSDDPSLGSASALIGFFTAKKYFLIQPSEFSQPVKNEIDNNQSLSGQFYLPLYSSSSLEALLILGKKASEDPYSSTDLNLFRLISSQSAIILDRLAAYEEKLTAQKQLLQADKMSSLGRISAGIAHEIKNPLAAIKGLASLLDSEFQNPEFIADFKKVVPKEIDRINSLAEDLLAFGRLPKPKMVLTNLDGLIDQTLKLLQHTLAKNNISVAKNFGLAQNISADPNQLTQVFTNIILNAADAMKTGGRLTLSTSIKEGSAIIAISDTGTGISENDARNIFEPFFSTKSHGTGLGLAVTKRIIEDHQGKITVESMQGEGTGFIISLPICLTM